MDDFSENATPRSEIDALRRELAEARRQQAAAAEVLRIVSRPGTDAGPVFDAILQACHRLYSPFGAAIYLVDGDMVKGAARLGFEGSESDWGTDASPLAGSSTGRAIAERRPVHIPDLAAVASLPEDKRAVVIAYGGMSTLYAPMISGERGVGSLVVARLPKRPFSEAEIASISAFADQAVIAIENARLQRETQQALAHQTATADVLKAINRSAFDPQAVLEALIDSAVSLSGSSNGLIWRYENGAMHARAFAQGEGREDFVAFMRAHPQVPGVGSITARVARTGTVHNIPDLLADPDYSPDLRRVVQLRATLGVPMKRGDDLIGAIVMSKPEAGAYSERIVELVETFADQAVIAIENARLFKEVNEALAQQQASAEILGAVSQSIDDAAPVFDRIVEACGRLFGAENAALFRVEDDYVRMAAGRGPLVERGRNDVTLLEASYTGRVARTRKVLHIPDEAAEPGLSEVMRERVRQAGGVSLFYAPILAGERILGSVGVLRSPPRPFSPKELALAQTFANQAAIAIRNAELFAQVRDRTRDLESALERQQATSRILEVIASSPADAGPVFEAIAASADVIMRGRSTAVYRFIDGRAHLMAMTSTSPEGDAALRANFSLALADFAPFALVSAGAVSEIPDTELVDNESFRNLARTRGYRSLAFAPLMRQGAPIGMLSATRAEPGAFAPADVALLRAFADQAVIAIENARLFEEVQGRTREVEEALAQQTATADVLRVISRSPSDLKPVLDAIADTAARLCGSEMTMFFRFDGEAFRILASWNFPPDVEAMLAANPLAPGHPSALGRAGASLKPVYIPDVTADPGYGLKTEQSRADYRATLAVPMLREGQLVGALSLNRSEPGSFTPNHIALVSTFADQAAIAFENVRLFEEVRARTRDTEEALAQQTATADVLKVISRSVFDLDAVLQMLIDTAVRLARGSRGTIFIRQGDMLAGRAFHDNVPASLKDYLVAHPIPLDSDEPVAQAVKQGRLIHVPDMSVYNTETVREARKLAGFGAALWAPLMRDGEAIGVFGVPREQPIPFSEREIELVRTFADQAVIAIENARLFNEVQARTRDLEISLAQQTATADVLKTISRSAFELQTVLETLIATAVDLNEAETGAVCVRDGDVFRYRAFRASSGPNGLPQHLADNPIRGDRGTIAGRAILSRQIEQIPDVLADSEFRVPMAALGNPSRALVAAPLIGKAGIEGALVLARREPGLCTPRQIEILKTFADQAVIAIENARLLAEVQARTLELQDSLERQNATAEILRVISSSPTDIKPVFDAICATAARLFSCFITGVFWVEGATLNTLSGSFSDRLFEPHEMAPSMPLEAGHNYPALAAVEKRTVYVRDYRAADPPPHERFISERYGLICGLYLPLLRKGECIGVFLLTSREADHFNERDIALAESFRDQAMIAVENTRLFNETQEALAQQTATADVLKTISRSAFDLQTVLDTLVESAARLCEADMASINQRIGSGYPIVASFGYSAEFEDFILRNPPQLGRGSVAGRTVLEGRALQIVDVLSDPDFEMKPGAITGGTRTMLGVPLLRAGNPIGVLVLSRKMMRPFSAKQIELVETFADQAVIAIENARLFAELQARTLELEQSLADLRKAQDRLVQSEKLASLGQLTAGIAHEIKNPLNFVNNFASLSRELVGEMKEALALGQTADVEELTGLIDSNLEKVVHHGRRADSIVKNMLLHSREGSGTRERVDVNAMVEEALNLAYHGARAEKAGFNVAIDKALDPATGEAELYLQEVTRVLLNLIGNGFYATAKRRETEGPDYQPTLQAATRSLGARVEIRIRDNGPGVPEEVRAKMFNPFFTTKPAGEGTGLGLSLSHDIVVKQHGGTLEVETSAGEFAEFIVTLPRGGAGA